MQLSKQVLSEADQKLLALPEKVLQFGTGVLLRALPDYFIDKANRQGLFKGRVVIVKSTDSDSSAFEKQDGLYTVCVRGVEQGRMVEENMINASVSRVLSASSDWEKILACAHNPEMKIIISNTTEVGIQLVEESVVGAVPHSFPGKLLAFLFERYKMFQGDPASGMVIIPTELITENGFKLKSIVLELAGWNKLELGFLEWVENNNTFCNSLVDRIVPGKPSKEVCEKLEGELGYSDELLTMSEVFRLWAIEGDEKVKSVLGFSGADVGVVVAPDITMFKELKLRLLNGTHTMACGLGYLAGFGLTREAMMDEVFSMFTKNLMKKEIANAIPYLIDEEKKQAYADNVFERFCNPFIDHQWLSITLQYSTKMKMRNVPLLKRHYELTTSVPMRMATGFAGFLYFMKATKKEGDKYFGERNGVDYEIKDAAAAYFYEVWKMGSLEEVVHTVMDNTALWEAEIGGLPGLKHAVSRQLVLMMEKGVLQTIMELERKEITV